MTAPPFPEIDNPLNEIDFLQRALKEATELSELIVTQAEDLQTYRIQDGSLYNGWVKNNHDLKKNDRQNIQNDCFSL